jgi:hypothetical protein
MENEILLTAAILIALGGFVFTQVAYKQKHVNVYGRKKTQRTTQKNRRV